MGNIADELKFSKFEELKDHNKMLDVEMVCLRTEFLTLSPNVHNNLRNIDDLIIKIKEIVKECIPEGDRHEKSK